MKQRYLHDHRAGVSLERPGHTHGGTEPRWRPVSPEKEAEEQEDKQLARCDLATLQSIT